MFLGREHLLLAFESGKGANDAEAGVAGLDYIFYVALLRGLVGIVEDVIEPRNTRFRVIRALAALEGKKQVLPAKKHDNLPL